MLADCIQFRTANQLDSGALSRIYAPYVESTPVSFEYEAPDENRFGRRMVEVMYTYPYLVAERAGEPVGFAYAHRHAERAAFDWNAELSVYLAPEVCGRGIGRRLYMALMELLRLQGVRNVYGLVCAPNPASERLHESLGFSLAGTWHRTGFKFGEWHDLLLYEKRLAGEDPVPMAPVVPFCKLAPEQVEAVLSAFSTET